MEKPIAFPQRGSGVASTVSPDRPTITSGMNPTSAPPTTLPRAKRRNDPGAQARRDLARVKKTRDVLRDAADVLRERAEVKYRVMDLCRDTYPVRLMCRCLRVSPSGYCAWRSCPQGPRAQDNGRPLVRIQELHEASDGVFGALRMWEELRYEGEACSRNRVARLIRLHGLHGVPARGRRRKKKRGSGGRPAGIEDHLARNFVARRANAKWVTDITEISTEEGKLYLRAVQDLYSKEYPSAPFEANRVPSPRCLQDWGPLQGTREDSSGQVRWWYAAIT